MGFGSRLCSRSVKRLGYAAGSGFGRGNSLRAEGTGMLSIALFLGLRVVTEYIGHDSLRVHFISDNLGLINISRDHLTYTIPYVNTTVQAEHDLIEQIYRTNKTNNIKATLEHVYVHQDDKVAKEDLPLPAQLNV